jgi:hypothetical protein
MKILHAEINWMDKYANSPNLIVVVDKLPVHKAHKVKVIDENATAVWAETDGFVTFFYHSRRDQNGFGGRTFKITDENGKEMEFKGPWSSRSSQMNKLFPHCTEVTLFEGSMEGTAWSANLTIELAKKALALATNGKVEYELDNSYEEIHYVIPKIPPEQRNF